MIGSAGSPARPPGVPVSSLGQTILSYAYIWWWVKRANFAARFSKYFAPGTRIVLTVYLIVLIGEVVAEMTGHHVATTKSLAYQAVFFVFIAVALTLKLREWREHGQEFYFAGAATDIVLQLGQMDSSKRDDEAIHRLLGVVAKTFEEKGVMNANLALPETVAGGEALRVKHAFPKEAKYDANLLLKPGQGGSGVSFRDRCVVYIPSRKYRHAIIQSLGESRAFGMVPDCYEACKVEDFKSILSVPLIAYGDCLGVLNFDSKRRNVFTRKDFEHAMFYGCVLAMYLHHTKP